jgi:hypothetical protein
MASLGFNNGMDILPCCKTGAQPYNKGRIANRSACISFGQNGVNQNIGLIDLYQLTLRIDKYGYNSFFQQVLYAVGFFDPPATPRFNPFNGHGTPINGRSKRDAAPNDKRLRQLQHDNIKSGLPQAVGGPAGQIPGTFDQYF